MQIDKTLGLSLYLSFSGTYFIIFFFPFPSFPIDPSLLYPTGAAAKKEYGCIA